MNNKTRNLAQMINSLIGSVICFLLSWFGFITVWTNYIRNTTVIKGLVMPKYIVILPIFIGSVLLTIQFLIRAYNFYKGYKNNGSNMNTENDEEVVI
jgi:TRAP-type C4-dicarboxylate transport system permease small subunit